MQSWREQAGEGRERKGGREYEADDSLTACGPCSLTCIALFMTGSLATAHIEQASPHIITTLVSRFSKGLVCCLDSRADDAALDSAYLTNCWHLASNASTLLSARHLLIYMHQLRRLHLSYPLPFLSKIWQHAPFCTSLPARRLSTCALPRKHVSVPRPYQA
jgi:hypothetical protein